MGPEHPITVNSPSNQQVIPLYMYQDPSDSDVLDTSSKATRGGERGTAPPAALMAFPPLAYLLNTLLTGLNFLKDTPLVAVQEKVLGHLEVVLKDVCHFLVSVSDDVRAKGKKYFSSSADLVRAAGTLYPSCMDRVYATVISDELVMHSLRCFQMIYFGEGGAEGEKTKKKKGETDSPIALQQQLQVIAESCKRTLLSAGLIDAVLVASKKDDSAASESFASGQNESSISDSKQKVAAEGVPSGNMTI
jgi:hypothetical protein